MLKWSEVVKEVAEMAGCEPGEVERIDFHPKEYAVWVVIRKSPVSENVVINLTKVLGDE